MEIDKLAFESKEPDRGYTIRASGYALAVHGSLSYDIDLIACPWTTTCTSAESVAAAIQEAVRAIVGHAENIGEDGPERKPHGRLAWSFHMGGGPYVDLSVMPSNARSEPTARLFAQVGSTDGLGVAVPPTPTLEQGEKK